ncbi:MAG: sodium:proline symporter [Elusimicrobia bacterium]|nr:MAG: sodium:proline symporter [Elusimicrobiota bacterium]
MTLDSFLKFGVVAIYFAGLFVIAYYASKRVKDIKDFYVGGKTLNYWIVAFSSRATGESGWLLLGLTGMGFAVGAHALWVLMGEMLGVVACWVFLTQRFKALTDRYESITIPDYLESRVSDTSHGIRIVSAIVLVVFVTAYLSAQLAATGKAFETFLGLPNLWGIMVGLIIILAYTVAGGFIAVAWSDFLQGGMMVAGLTLLPIVAIVHIGGFTPLFEGLSAQDPGLLSPWGTDGFGIKSVLSAVGLATVGIGYLGSPQLSVRFMALRDIKEIRQGSVVAALFTLFADGGAVFTGMCGRVIFKTLTDQETVLPMLVNELMPAILVGLFIAVVLAAIMSTADSLLILASSAVVRDVYQKILHPEASDKSLTEMSRLVTCILMGLALVFALKGGTLVFWFVLFGWAGITSVFCPAIVLSLFWKGLTRQGVLAGMITGFVVTIVWNSAPIGWWTAIIPGFKGWLAAHGFAEAKSLSNVLYEIFPAVVASTAATIAVSLKTPNPENAAVDLDAIHSEVIDVWR